MQLKFMKDNLTQRVEVLHLFPVFLKELTDALCAGRRIAIERENQSPPIYQPGEGTETDDDTNEN